jgi:hypothetical protein
MRFRPLPEFNFASVAVRSRQYVPAIYAQGNLGQSPLPLSIVWLKNRPNRMWELTGAISIHHFLLTFPRTHLTIVVSQTLMMPHLSAETMKRPVESVAIAKISLSWKQTFQQTSENSETSK